MIDLLCCVMAVGLHLGSAHIDPYPTAPQLSGSNPGAYIQFKNDIVIGTFRNSLRKQSNYLAYAFPVFVSDEVEGSIVVGGITGYPQHKVTPLIMPVIRFKLSDHAGIRVGYLPKIQATQAHVLHFMVEYRF